MTETLLRPSEPVVNVRSPSLKYRLWLGLGFNAFTCGLMLGIIIYHLIPHVSCVDLRRCETNPPVLDLRRTQ